MKSFCIICGRETMHFPQFQNLKRCEVCSLVSARRQPGQEDLARIYGREYFWEGEYLDYSSEKTALQKNFKRWVGILRRWAPHGNLFEIGCAYGFFLELARNYWTVRGVDISPHASDLARKQGLDVETGDFLDLPVEVGKYNIFCLWDTIEHLKTPHLYIQKIAEVIAPGGYICLTTGDIDGFVPKLQKEKWRMIHPPTHLYYFSQETLAQLLRMHQFKVVYSAHVGFNRSIKRALFNLAAQREGGLWRNLYNFHESLHLPDFSFYLNLFDIFMMIAEKEK
jgi:SAM-dependent methyltransferase